jgi:hypothetical protein
VGGGEATAVTTQAIERSAFVDPTDQAERR